MFIALATIALASQAYAGDVTVSGNAAFSSLDGSVLDHDGLVNGVFTVAGGNLTILGSVNCNDEGSGNASACPMRFVVSGNMTILAGGALYAENRTGPGSGGNITLDIGENLLLQGSAVVSSGAESNDAGGDITFKVAGTTTLDAGSIVSSASKGGRSGAIAIDANTILVNGLVASGPSGSGSSNQQGGAITLRSTTTVSVGASATIVSQGRHNGSSLVLLEGCGLDVHGLIASVADRGTTSAVTLRSGTTIVVDGGMLRADSATHVLARDSIRILGLAGSLYALNGGTVDVVSTDGTVTVSGNVARAADIDIAAKGNVTADTGVIRANGGAIALRSHSGAVSWNLGIGDVSPGGTITLTYCTTTSTAGSSFLPFFPTFTQTCSPASPSLPAGETLPNCNDAPVATDDAYNVAEGGTLNVPAPGVLANDVDAGGDPMTATLVSGPAHASSFSLNADGSFTYVHDGSETTSDSFTYKANDGSAGSNVATVTITIAAVNDAPIANDDSYSVSEGGTLNEGVLTNDADPDSTLTAILLSGPAHASSFTLNADGSFTYVHDGSETTSDSFSYKANDGALDSNVATVTITIEPVNDPPAAFAFAGLPAQAGIRITYPAGKLGGTDVEAGTTVTVDPTAINVVNGTVTINANGSFVFTPLPGAAGGTASFQYRVSDNGNPAPGVNSAYVTVSFNVAGPAIYFTRSVPVGSANCTLGNECTVAGAVASIGSSPNAHIFIGDTGTQTLASIALNSGGTIIGQGVQAASFDAFFGIVAPAQGTLAPRPLVNQVRPTLATTVILNNNSQVRGFNLTPSNDGLVATGKTGLAVSQMNITSDSNLPGTFCVNFTNSSGTFLFGPIAVNTGRNGSGVKFDGSTSATAITFNNVTMGGSGDAVIIANSGSTGFFFNDVVSNTGRAVDINGGSGQFVFRAISANGAGTGILVQSSTGLFNVNGTNGLPGTGGTIQNCTEKGADFRASRNINLRGMTFTNNATVDGPGAACARVDLSTTNNGPLNCNANISLLSVTNALLTGVAVTGSQQIGIDGQSVNGLTIQNTTIAGNGNGTFEDGVQMSNLTGTVTINANNVFRDAAANLFEIVNDSGTMFASFSASTFRYTTFPSTSGNSGLHIVGRGSAVINPFVGTSTFQNINSSAVRMDLSGAASGLLSVGGAGSGNTFTNNAQGIGISAVGTGTINYSIRDNTLTNDTAVTSTFGATAISTSFSGAATRTGTIDNNTIGTNLIAAVASGCFAAGCDGIQVTDSAATGTHRVTVSNNRIFHVNGAAIRVTSGSGSADTFRVRIANNTANFPDNPLSTASGILVEDANATPNGVFMTCLDVTGNQISGLWAGGTSHKSAIGIVATRAQQFSLTNFNAATEYPTGAVTVGCTGECTNTAGLDGNAADFLSQQNPATVTAQALSGGSSASQQRLSASAPWTGTSGICP